MKSNKFSIIIPTRGESLKLQRAIQSVLSQTYQEWELIIVNDAGPTPKLPDDPRVTLYEQPRLNKSYARNLGMEHAIHEWICWLDDDDAYINFYLEALDQAITEFPEYRLFNFGGIVVRAKGTRGDEKFRDVVFREPFEHEDHARFYAGKIATGHFIFHRSLLSEDILPKETNPYLFADAMKKRFPELMEHYGPLYMEGGKELGNPWGDDFAAWYVLTRNNKHKTLPFYLYIQFCRL